MSATRNINVLLTGNASQLRGTLMTAGRDVEAFTRQTENAGTRMDRAMKLLKVGAAAGALAVGAAFGYSVTQAVAFEKQMRNVNSISNLSEEALAELSKQVGDLSREFPQSSTTLAEGLYEISSSGFQGAEGLKVLRASAEAASAGMTNTETSAKGIVAVLNSYGLAASEAEHVSNVLFKGVDVGVMSFEELASTVGDYMATAAAANVTIEETTAAMAAMTLAGIGAAEAGTSMSRLLTTLIDPGEDLAKVFREWGYESGEAALNAEGLTGIMERLREQTGGNVTELLKLFPEIRAARGAMALMANEGENYAKTSQAMADADEGQGATKAALAEQMKSLSFQFQLFKNWVNGAAGAVGAAAIPRLMELLNVTRDLGGTLGEFVGSTGEQLSGFFEDVGESAGNVVEILGDLWDAARPAATAVAGIAALGVVSGLKAAGDVLERVTGLVADHADVVALAVGAYAGLKAAMAMQAAIAALSGGLAAAVGWVQIMAIEARLAATALFTMGTNAQLGMQMLGTSLAGGMTAISAFKFATAGAVAGIFLVGQEWSEASAESQAAIDAITSKIDTLDPSSIAQGANELREQAVAANEAAEGYQGWLGRLKAAAGVLPLVSDHGHKTLMMLRDSSAATVEQQRAYGALIYKYKEAALALEGWTEAGRTVGTVTQVPQESVDSVYRWVQALEEAGVATAELNPDELAAAIERQKAATENSVPATDALTEAVRVLGDETSSAKEELEAWKAVIDNVFGVQKSVFDSTTAYRGAIDDLTASLKENAWGGLDPMTEAGRSNRKALGDAAESGIELAKAYAAIGDEDSAIYMIHETRNQLVEVMRQAGMSEEAINSYLTELGLTPDNVETIVNAATAEANLAIDETTGKLNDLDGRVVKSFVEIEQLLQNRYDSYTEDDWANYGGGENRRMGGIHEVARMGRVPAYVTHNPTILHGERETGGEAMIPRLGEYGRSMSFLGQAAGWYGAAVIDKSVLAQLAAQSGGSSSPVVNLHEGAIDARGVSQGDLGSVVGQRIGWELV